MDTLRTFLDQVRKFWTALSNTKRIALLTMVSAVLLGVILIATVGSRINYGYLYTDLEREDAAAIAQKLDELHIPYKVDAGGSAIMVENDRVYQTRLTLASDGLPRGGSIGFEIFDGADLGATEFEQKVKLRRALEGELARSIATINGVQSARIHLVMPERRLFANRSEGSSASVVLKLRNRSAFGKGEVAGIVHLVSSAVPGLSPEKVSVVSSDGITLHRPDHAGGEGLGDGRSEQSREISRDMEEHVRSLLERVTGPGSVDVRVSVDLDEATRERTEEHYEPARTALRSEHKVEERDGVEGKSVAGVPGAQTNMPDIEPSVATTGGDATGGDGVTRKTQTRNWEVDRVTERINTPAGAMRRLSVAVLVDGEYIGEGAKQTYRARSAEEVAQLDAIVRNAVGFVEQRGDTVRVEAARFAREAPEPPEVSPVLVYGRKYWREALAGIGGLVFLCALIMALRWNKKRKKAKMALAKARREELAESNAPYATDGEMVDEEYAEDEEALPLPAGETSALLDPAMAEERRQELFEFLARDPASAALILRSWLHAPPPAITAALPTEDSYGDEGDYQE